MPTLRKENNIRNSRTMKKDLIKEIHEVMKKRSKLMRQQIHNLTLSAFSVC